MACGSSNIICHTSSFKPPTSDTLRKVQEGHVGAERDILKSMSLVKTTPGGTAQEQAPTNPLNGFQELFSPPLRTFLIYLYPHPVNLLPVPSESSQKSSPYQCAPLRHPHPQTPLSPPSHQPTGTLWETWALSNPLPF